LQYSINEVAKKVNLTAYTIRYNEKEGLLPSIERDKHGNRLFSDEDVEWISLICCLRDTGMPVYMLKHYWISIWRVKTVATRRQIMLKKQIIEQKIEKMKYYLEKIDKKIKYLWSYW